MDITLTKITEQAGPFAPQATRFALSTGYDRRAEDAVRAYLAGIYAAR